MLKVFDKEKIIKTKSPYLKSTGRISKQLLEEKELLEGRLIQVKNALALLKEHSELEKLIGVVINPLEIEK